jgi:cysteine desulfurase
VPTARPADIFPVIMAEPIYLDHAATTPVQADVRSAMLPYLDGTFGNPSSAHRFGRAARAGLDEARRQVAAALACEPSHVVFTSGGTEADNLAVIGAALAARAAGRPMRVAVAATEHKAVLAAAHAVEALGGDALELPVHPNGLLDLDALDAVLATGPALVSVMWVNNEVGTVQPVAEIAARCRAAGVRFHTDAVQALGKIPLDLAPLRDAMVTISGHKIGAPKGVGALVVRERRALEALVHGGGQQFGIRPGTENVSGAVALGAATRLALAAQPGFTAQTAPLRDALQSALQAAVPDLVVVGAEAPRAPHILTVAVPGAEAETLLMHLDLAGIAASGGSACSTGALTPSHVLTAMGLPRDLALGALRFSFGMEHTTACVARVAEVFPRIVERARKLAGALGRA